MPPNRHERLLQPSPLTPGAWLYRPCGMLLPVVAELPAGARDRVLLHQSVIPAIAIGCGAFSAMIAPSHRDPRMMLLYLILIGVAGAIAVWLEVRHVHKGRFVAARHWDPAKALPAGYGVDPKTTLGAMIGAALLAMLLIAMGLAIPLSTATPILDLWPLWGSGLVLAALSISAFRSRRDALRWHAAQATIHQGPSRSHS